MEQRIDDTQIDRLCSLSMLTPPGGTEREVLRGELTGMLEMLDGIRKTELPEGTEGENILLDKEDLREDLVTNKDAGKVMLENAPEVKEGAFIVPRTFA